MKNAIWKRKSLRRLKSKLYKELRPETDLATLAQVIADFLATRAGKSARGKYLANILASYLAQKYSISDRKSGRLDELIERHPDHLAAFLNEISFKEFQALAKMPTGRSPPSLKELVEAASKPPEEVPASENEVLPPKNQAPRRRRKRRRRPKNETERSRRRKEAKNRYEERRREYRDGLILKQFGTYPFPTRYRGERPPPEGDCLDVLLSGGSVSKAAQAGSLEDLFGIDRHRFPKALRCKRSGRHKVYNLREFLKCMIHLLAKPDGKEPWLPEGSQRQLVVTGIISRTRRDFPKVQKMVVEKLRPYLR